MPLDFYTAHFFESRRVKIEHRIEELQQMDSEVSHCVFMQLNPVMEVCYSSLEL